MRGNTIICVCALALLSASPAIAALTYDTVAITGQQAPGQAEGVVFSSFMGGLINDSGQVALHCSLTGPGISSSNRWSTWTTRTGNLSLSVQQGDPAPGMGSGSTFSTLDFPTFSDSGKVVFMGIWGYPGGYWSENEGTVSDIAIIGGPAPVPDVGATIHDFTNGFGFDYLGAPALNGVGHTAFYATISNTSIPNTDRAVISGAGGTLHAVARSYEQAPGTEEGTLFHTFGRKNSYRPALNNQGQTAFAAQLRDAHTLTSRGIWVGDAGDLNLVVSESDQAPGTQDNTFYSFGDPRINDAGQVAFWAQIRAPVASNTGIWAGDADSMRLIAHENSQAPGLPNGTYFAEFDDAPLINHEGYVGFVSGLRGTDVSWANDTALWAEGPNGLSLVAREGDQVPGAPLGVLFGDFDYIDSSYQPLSMNASGLVAFTANLTGEGIIDDYDTGVFVRTLSGDLITIALAGELFEVAPGDVRTISEAYYVPGSGGEDGWEEGLNDAGELALLARFTDGTSGIFTVQIPEPTTVCFVCLGGMIVCRRSRRRA